MSVKIKYTAQTKVEEYVFYIYKSTNDLTHICYQTNTLVYMIYTYNNIGICLAKSHDIE